jgi:hypothetical protein
MRHRVRKNARLLLLLYCTHAPSEIGQRFTFFQTRLEGVVLYGIIKFCFEESVAEI